MNILIIKIINKLKLLKYLNLSVKVTVNERRIKIPILHKIGTENIILSEPWMNKVLKKICFNSLTIIDVGINTGQTLLKIKSLFPQIYYYGFEPNVLCVNYIKNLIKINAFEKTSIIPCGLSNTNEVVSLYVSNDEEGTDAAGTIIKDFRKLINPAIQNICVFQFDYLKAKLNINKVDVIKIDVEGFELFVLQGMLETIKNDRPTIICEVLPVYTPENIARLQNQEDIEKILKENNYLIYRIVKGENVTYKHLNKIEIHSNVPDCDYVFCPAEKIGIFN